VWGGQLRRKFGSNALKFGLHRAQAAIFGIDSMVMVSQSPSASRSP
jgi:hypothetical protein